MDIDKDERKRLVRLQEDGPKGVGAYGLKELTYPDLQLLLVADPTIQKLIRQIVQPMLAASESEETIASESDKESLATDSVSRHIKLPVQPLPIKIEKVIEKVPDEVRVEVPVYDPLRGQLLPELKLLQAVQADTELAGAWLEANESEGRQLMRLLSMVSEWEEVLRLWGRLAERCKKDQRTATGVELQILQAVLAFNNLRWRDRSASLVSAQIGADFHHETMERGTPKGSMVQAVWLPGIANAAGQVQKKPLVST